MSAIRALLMAAEGLYWLVGSLVVIGGFFIFVTNVVRESRSSRRQGVGGPRARHTTNVYVTHLHVWPGGLFLPKADSRQRGLRAGTDVGRTREIVMDTLELLEERSIEEAASLLAERWSPAQMNDARLWCQRALDTDVPPVLEDLLVQAVVVLEYAAE